MTTIVTTREDLAAIMTALMPAPTAMPPEVVRLELLKRKETLTTEEVEALYGLNASTLRKHRVNGTGPAYLKEGERVLYTHPAVKKYLESRRQKTHDQP
jgi:hypothetical protein